MFGISDKNASRGDSWDYILQSEPENMMGIYFMCRNLFYFSPFLVISCLSLMICFSMCSVPKKDGKTPYSKATEHPR